ncbi:MAG: DUF1566 domain-containing protein [Planctomycetes bacterium]|nr:DUF1566 domain-containing protein [Planctomycetota bacterium]
MKFWVGIVLGVAVGVGGAILVRTPRMTIAEERYYRVPGDVNGDGNMNIADPMFLLNYIFAFGPAPVPCEPCPGCDSCCPARLTLPATGQTESYRDGDDGNYRTGCPTDARFVDNGDDTVTDNCTGLMWQQTTADTNGDGTVTDGDQLAWDHAIDYCNDLDFAGHSDWRLPNVRELQSIVDYGRFDPAIDPVFEAQASSRYYYWSSSGKADYSDTHAWEVGFTRGSVGDADSTDKTSPLHVRAVRTAQ